MGQAENNNTQLPKSRPEEPEWTVSDKNHDAILLIPDILARLVKLLTFDRVSFSREVGPPFFASLFGCSMPTRDGSGPEESGPELMLH